MGFSAHQNAKIAISKRSFFPIDFQRLTAFDLVANELGDVLRFIIRRLDIFSFIREDIV